MISQVVENKGNLQLHFLIHIRNWALGEFFWFVNLGWGTVELCISGPCDQKKQPLSKNQAKTLQKCVSLALPTSRLSFNWSE